MAGGVAVPVDEGDAAPPPLAAPLVLDGELEGPPDLPESCEGPRQLGLSELAWRRKLAHAPVKLSSPPRSNPLLLLPTQLPLLRRHRPSKTSLMMPPM